MKRRAWIEALERAIEGLEAWEGGWPGGVVPERTPAAEDALGELVSRLGDNYPFFHPRYAGQMLKPPHPIAWAAYATAMLVNPNNHALDGGPATAAMEREGVAALAGMLGFPTAPDAHLGHLTGGGTMANLEALWVCRELAPGKRIAYSEAAHYTHGRMCGVLGVKGHAVPVDARGRMDIGALARELERGDVAALVATPGTPETDIVAFAPAPAAGARASEISRRSESILARGMARGDGIYLATFAADRALAERAWPHADITWDRDTLTILRSVLMKPEHESFVPTLAQALDDLAEACA